MKSIEYAIREESINMNNNNPFDDLVLRESKYSPNKLVYSNSEHNVWLYQANCLEFMDKLIKKFPEGKFDMIFADPPYFLSNGGISCHAGKMVKVHKGDWDKSRGAEVNHEFNREWLKRCQALLKPNGTMWISGTQHVIFSIGYAMQQLDMKILNDISKTFTVTDPQQHFPSPHIFLIFIMISFIQNSKGSSFPRIVILVWFSY